MLPTIQARYSDAILHEALQRAGLPTDAAESLGGFEAHVFKLPGEVLKITHTLRRSEDTLMGEVEFINHLADKGVSVPRALPFTSGAFIAPIPDGHGGTFLAYRFEEARGRTTRFEDWSDTLLQSWGRLAGEMVRATADFEPSTPARRRRHWHEDPILDLRACLSPEHAETIRCGEALLARLRALPTTPDVYRLIHADLHPNNFFCDDAGRLTPFDFDDCEHGPTVREVSVPMYYALSRVPKGVDKAKFGEHFLVQFVRGFQQASPLHREQLAHLPDLLLLRSLILLSVLTTYAQPDTEEGRVRWESSRRRFREQIKSNEVGLDIDFARLARQLTSG